MTAHLLGHIPGVEDLIGGRGELEVLLQDEDGLVRDRERKLRERSHNLLVERDNRCCQL